MCYSSDGSFKDPKDIACNNGAGGSTQNDMMDPIPLTEPQGKLKK